MPNTAAITADNLVNKPIQPGDVGFIIGPDLSFRVFSTHKLDGDDLTPEQVAQGEILFTLAVAMKIPEVMAVLKRMAADERIVGKGVDIRLHS